MPKFSVIIPTCNRSRNVAEAIEALKKQNPDGIHEVIVVEDGDTLPRVHDASELPLKRLRTGSRSGPGAARNEGARVAEAELLLFMDDDITLAPGALDAMAALYNSRGGESTAISVRILPSPDLDFNVYLRFAYRGVAHSKGGTRGGWSFMHFCSSCMGVERNAFLRLGGFNECLLRYEDSDLGFRLQESGTRLLFPASIVAYHGKPMDREWFVRRCEFTGPYLKKFHRLHPGAVRGYHRVFYNRIFGRLSDRLARAAIRRLGIVESLPDDLGILTLKGIHALSMLAGYVYGEREYR